MKHSLRATLVVACFVSLGLTLALGSASGGGAAQGPKQFDHALLKQLRDSARGSVTVSMEKATGFAVFIRAGKNGDLFPADKGGSPEGKARGFLRRFGPLLGASGADAELVQTSRVRDRYGATHVSYVQRYNGLPVFGATVRAHLDANGDLTAINGAVVPDIDVDTRAKLEAGEAARRAIAMVADDPPVDAQGNPAEVSVVTLRAASTSLQIYRTGLIRGAEGTNQLVYVVEVTNGANVRDLVFVHANAGKLVNRYSFVHDALFRRLFEGQEDSEGNPLPPVQVWQEGDPFPGTLNADQQNIVNFSGHAYYHFFNAFGRDSYDGAGHEMQSINNDPRINCPNANWNGITTNYCNGVTADDVVAHEWSHAYTQFTHNLIYQWQPGALNESYSDIWGETVDMLNGAGTDSPAGVRSANACSSHTTPLPVLIINSPEPRQCAAGSAAFGPPLTFSGTTGNVVLALDGTSETDPSTTNGCTALTNAAEVAGNIALVDRGVCGFTVKVKNAQNAGAIGVVVANNTGTGTINMGGSDPTITIPSLLISLPNGNIIKAYLADGETVNVTMRLTADPASGEDSYRWLMGEDSTAFGGAIRDMWTPTCLADPGKVSDVQYHCDTSDAGGVHTNSGVPNHGYALLADGGTYNGHTVAALGLVKTAHLYWRAQSVYQTPTSKFADHADALEASCSDLVGIPLEGLSTSSTPAGPSGQSITQADCNAVTEMIAAVELRTDPTQCNFQPLLQKNPPALCANQKNPPVIYEEDFEDGLAGWTLTNQGVYAGWPGLNWQQETSLPGGRSGSAAFAADPDQGDCGQGAGDISGVMRMESPAIHIPATGLLSPRLTFEHYVATEASFDGGNLKISINGGAYTLVPASAYVFNPYNLTLTTAAGGNTNPLAGQPAFSGTDGGEVHGSWGQSQVNLVPLGVEPGDTIQLRFDFGMDGCTGIDGWYVDDLKVRACNTKKAAASLTVTARRNG